MFTSYFLRLRVVHYGNIIAYIYKTLNFKQNSELVLNKDTKKSFQNHLQSFQNVFI